MPDEPQEHPTPEEAPLSPYGEELYRKFSRRAVTFTIVVIVVVIAGAAYLGATAVSGRFKGAKDLDHAFSLLRSADGVVLDVDEVVRSQVSTDVAARARVLQARVPGARRDLQEAERLVHAAGPKVTEDEQHRGRLLQASAAARLSMLEPADTLLTANAKAGESLGPATAGWALMLAAESRADESVREYNKLTKPSVTRSNELLSQATDELKQARSDVETAAAAFPEAGFGRYLDFIDGKIALLAISRQSNDAWLAGNVAATNAAIGRYNAKERRVLDLAATLPETPAKAVADAYKSEAEQATARYDAARKQATAADAQLKAY